MPIDWAAVGAFLSGIGAVLSAIVTIRMVRRRLEADCRQRIADIKQALHEGYEMRREEQ